MSKGYLFVHFTGESENGEQIYFSVSRDGLRWQDLNGGRPVLTSSIGEKGVRDPFILRSPIDGRFYILATDLRIASGKGWEAARSRGSRKIIIWSSADLIRWTPPWYYEVPLKGAGSVWAPEACFDALRETWLVFWASLTYEPGDEKSKFRIFSADTKDFIDFSAPRKFLEQERSVIDTTIVRDGEHYYRFSKDEVTKGIILDRSADLRGKFSPIVSGSLDRVTGVEGPLAFRMPDGKTWCVMVDQFAVQGGYLPMLCDDLTGAQFRVLRPDAYDLGQTRKRHGSVLEISAKELEALCDYYG